MGSLLHRSTVSGLDHTTINLNNVGCNGETYRISGLIGIVMKVRLTRKKGNEPGGDVSDVDLHIGSGSSWC